LRAVPGRGDVQRMTAGTGGVHSEYNASEDEPVHFLQIWILPSKRGLQPGYEQKAFSDADKRGKLRLIASDDGRDGSVTIHSDARVYAGVFGRGDTAELAVPARRGAWVHVASRKIRLNGPQLLQ